MGLLGLLATLFAIFIYLTTNVKDSRFASEQRERAIRNGNVTYGDGTGHDRLTATGERVHVSGGKVYSLKDPNLVICDYAKDYYTSNNQRKLEEAKAKGEKRTMINFPNSESPNGWGLCWVEVSTGRRFEVDKVVYYNKEKGDWDFSFSKQYLTNDGKRDGDYIKITRKEFEDLGGYIPYGMTARQYIDEESKERERNYKQLMKGLK